MEWQIFPLKALFIDRTSGAWGSEPDDTDSGIICIRAADFVTHKLTHSLTDLTRRKFDEHEIFTKQLRKGDLILEKSGGGEKQPVGRVIRFGLEEIALCSNFLERLRPNTLLAESQYLAYLLYHLWLNRQIVPFIKQTTGIQNLDTSEYFTIGVSLPPLNKQHIIADYLNYETTQLDALIEATERLLDLLAEKRRALITHAVTRGLNPDVPLRDSGVEWLGLVPTHWETRKLKMVAEVRTGVAKGRNFGGASTIQVSYLRVANVQDGYLDLSDVAEIEIQPHELDGFRLKKGDLLMNEGGDADKLGRGAIWSGSIDPCVHQNHVFAVRCHDVDPEWLAWTIKGDHAKVYFESRSKQSTNLASISSTNLQEVTIPTPPAGEQRTIVEYIESETAKLAALRAATEHTRDLLHERRAALIAEAVTGKIHVAG